MKFDPTKHHRRSIRLKGYDYTSPGGYFITVVTYQRECLFGEIVNGEMRLNKFGKIAESCWYEIPDHFPNVKLGTHMVMPNHVHGIIIINESPTVGVRHASPLLGTIVGSYKSAVTKRINEIDGTPGAVVWQRNYFDHIICNEKERNNIHLYIGANPLNWVTDNENPADTKI